MLQDSPSALSRRDRLRVVGQLWLLEVVALALLCGAYAQALAPETLRGWFFVEGGRLSCAASLSLAPGLMCLGAAAFVRARRVLAVLSALIWSLVLFLVYVDTRIYAIFRYHFNGLVWNVLTTPGVDEAVQISHQEIRTVLLALALLVPLQGAAFLALWRWNVRRRARALAAPALARPGLAWTLVLVPNMLAVAGVYAWADLGRDPHVMAFARVYPLYPRLTIKRLAQEHFGVPMKERPEVDMPESGILLDYPQREPVLDPRAPRPNVVVIVIDSLRADMLSPEVMPHTSALAERGRVFRDHLSTGNATRFGLFGMIYGLHGSYWKAVYDEHRSPVLVDALLERGYDVRALTSASWDFPEFRSTLWVKVETSVEDRLTSTRPGARDDGVAARFEEWLAGRPGGEQPFFTFLLLDAPHGRYWFPEEHGVFRPFAEDVQFLKLSEGAAPDKIEQLFNRYRNSVHYDDEVVGRVLAALRRHGELEDTLVVVTGDHGEEFFEHGFWGHTSNFTRTQVRVPFVLAGPRVPPGVEGRPTSHLDLPATLLELLGADPAVRAEWTLGASLLAPPAQRSRVVAGWDTLGLYLPDSMLPGVILEVPMASYGGAEIAAYDARWRRLFEDEAILERTGRALGTLALECRRFLR